MALPCPNCAIDMHEVAAEATIGYRLLLDQCPRCGGIWCDRWELFPLSAEAAQRLDAVDRPALQQPFTASGGPLTCPRCRARMARFRDPGLPADVHIERCLNCEGMWLNRGDLRRLKPRRAARAPRHTPDATEIERLAQATRDPRSWPTVTNLDSAMQDPLEPGPEVQRELFTGGAWLVLRALVRLLFNF